MDEAARARLEAELRRRFDAGELDAVATAALRGYGPELFGFVVGLARDRGRAEEVFAAFSEKLWRALPKFRWDSSFRVWAYTMARNAALDAARVRERAVPLSRAPEAVAAEVRSTTALWRKTDVKDAFARVRAGLEPDDRALLGLRLEGGMGWRDIARVLGHTDEAELDRAAATLRKRFERLKERIKRELEAP